MIQILDNQDILAQELLHGLYFKSTAPSYIIKTLKGARGTLAVRFSLQLVQ